MEYSEKICEVSSKSIGTKSLKCNETFENVFQFFGVRLSTTNFDPWLDAPRFGGTNKSQVPLANIICDITL